MQSGRSEIKRTQKCDKNKLQTWKTSGAKCKSEPPTWFLIQTLISRVANLVLNQRKRRGHRAQFDWAIYDFAGPMRQILSIPWTQMREIDFLVKVLLRNVCESRSLTDIRGRPLQSAEHDKHNFLFGRLQHEYKNFWKGKSCV